MAALYALKIDNCLIEVNAPEFPILDGSSIQYVQGIFGVGTEEQTEERDYFVFATRWKWWTRKPALN
jgi:UDP-3-O-[3-hydroxymyristoyl] N-acetylglucosamine deacetylase (EC 3.5.1.-)/3-hydroxyacyl-[acyl-carrier-protein] dehydratase (EC 4.2.1.-)